MAGKVQDISGQRFGRLLIQHQERTRSGKSAWRCLCDCGNTVQRTKAVLQSPAEASCGCAPRRKRSVRRVYKSEDLTGKVFGRLTVKGRVTLAPGERGPFWLCLCGCGKECKVRAGNLKSGSTRSCGCLAKEFTTSHGKRNTRTWHVWAQLIQRCTNPNNKGYKNYGARGITVHPRWRDFSNFLADMGEAPEGLSIERVNNDGNYEPGNCEWATKLTQARNTRALIFLTVQGHTACLAAWAEVLGVDYFKLWRACKAAGNDYAAVRKLLPELPEAPTKFPDNAKGVSNV